MSNPIENPRQPRAGLCSALVVLQLFAAAVSMGCEPEDEPGERGGASTEDDDHHSDERDTDLGDHDEPADEPEPEDPKDAGVVDAEPSGNGDEPADPENPSDDKPATEQDAGAAEPKPEPTPEPAKKPIYAYIHTADDSSYVTLTNAVEGKSDSSALAPSQAREFEGGMYAISGNLVEHVEGSSMLKQWKVSDDLMWTEGPSVNFSQYPLPEGANLFFNYQIDERTMYMPFDINKRIVWDPVEMKIVKVMENSTLPVQRGGLMAAPAGNRTGIQYKGTIKAPFFYLDEDYIEFADTTTLAVYDRKTHEEVGLIDLPCPGLAIATQDEEGYTYYATWDYSPLLALYDRGPKPCLARLTPDDKVDTAWTTDLTELTDGRYGANFHYVRDGWGLMDVLHHETLDLDFDASTISEDALAEVWDRSHWRVWFVDLKNKTARVLDELGDDVNLAFWGINKVDDRVFLELNTEEETVKVYELSKTGVPTLHDQIVDGEATWRRVR